MIYAIGTLVFGFIKIILCFWCIVHIIQCNNINFLLFTFCVKYYFQINDKKMFFGFGRWELGMV